MSPLSLAELLDSVREELGVGEPGENAGIDRLRRAVQVAEKLAEELDIARADERNMTYYHANTKDIEEIVRILLGQPYARCPNCHSVFLEEDEVSYIEDLNICTECQESIDIVDFGLDGGDSR